MAVPNSEAPTSSNSWLCIACASTSVQPLNHALALLWSDSLGAWIPLSFTICLAIHRRRNSHAPLLVRLIQANTPSGRSPSWHHVYRSGLMKSMTPSGIQHSTKVHVMPTTRASCVTENAITSVFHTIRLLSKLLFLQHGKGLRWSSLAVA